MIGLKCSLEHFVSFSRKMLEPPKDQREGARVTQAGRMASQFQEPLLGTRRSAGKSGTTGMANQPDQPADQKKEAKQIRQERQQISSFV
jgi:hypothetical protein